MKTLMNHEVTARKIKTGVFIEPSDTLKRHKIKWKWLQRQAANIIKKTPHLYLDKQSKALTERFIHSKTVSFSSWLLFFSC